MVYLQTVVGCFYLPENFLEETLDEIDFPLLHPLLYPELGLVVFEVETGSLV